MTPEIQQWILSALIALIFLYLWVVLVPEESEDSELFGGDEKKRKPKSLFLKLFGGVIYTLGQFIGTLPLGKRREKLDEKLTQAGRPGDLSADEFHASRIVGIVLAVLAGMFMDSELDTAPYIAVLLGLLGLVYPDIWLSGIIEKRRRRIFRNLPDTLDVLRLAVDAGLDLSSAMKVVVERGRRGPLMEELEKVERDMTLGRTRAEALRSFADRIAMTEVNSFVLALIQADQLGASIGPVLKTQSEMARTRRWQLAEALVNKMPMKMLGPLVLFIFPSSFIILFTPLLIQWMQAD